MMFFIKLWHAFTNLLKWCIAVTANYGVWNAIYPRIRPWLWKLTGVKIKGKVCLGYAIYYDVNNSSKLIIEDGVWIASRCILFCHKRVLNDYKVGDDYNELPYKKQIIHLKRGCCIGMGSIVMPGVTVGEGAIIGAGSVVVKDIPSYTIAVGNPCKVVKELEK